MRINFKWVIEGLKLCKKPKNWLHEYYLFDSNASTNDFLDLTIFVCTLATKNLSECFRPKHNATFSNVIRRSKDIYFPINLLFIHFSIISKASSPRHPPLTINNMISFNITLNILKQLKIYKNKKDALINHVLGSFSMTYPNGKHRHS